MTESSNSQTPDSLITQTPESLITQTKDALNRFGKSISIITCCDEKGRYASPSSAVTNLSYEPPTLLLPLEKSASLYPLLSSGAGFCVNILGAGHEDIVNACIQKKGEERFSTGQWENNASGIPILQDAQASFVCEFEQLNEYATHGMLIGRIVAVRQSPASDPLIYVDGKFRRF